MKRILSGSAAIFYLLIALEVIIMITPFSAYFYSVYAPVLKALYAFPSTSWLTEFFLPHMAVPGDAFLIILIFLGPILFFAGLLIFFICAAQVYYAKLFKKGVVTKGLYSSIRHPQYLGLSISGLGLLLFWPRFFILVTYVSMLFIYYLLAKNEESRMEKKYPDAYREYISKTSMFIPKEPGAKIFSWIFRPIKRKGLALLILYIFVLSSGTGLGFALRGYTKSQISTLYLKDMAVISLTPTDEKKMKKIVETALADELVAYQLSNFERGNRMTYVAYLMPADYMMQHLIVDTGGGHEEHHGKGGAGSFIPVIRHLWEMFILRPQRQVWSKNAGENRIILTEASNFDGGYISPKKALGIMVKRTPFFLVDIDMKEWKVTWSMETPKRHSWGDIPLPIF